MTIPISFCIHLPLAFEITTSSPIKAFKAVLPNNNKIFGVTVHLMDEKVDSGKILGTKTFPIFANDNLYELLFNNYKLHLLEGKLESARAEIGNDLHTKVPKYADCRLSFWLRSVTSQPRLAAAGQSNFASRSNNPV